MQRAPLEEAWQLFRTRSGFAEMGIGRAHLQTTVDRAMGRLGLRDPDSFVARLRADETVFDDFVDDMMIGESYFFREPQQCQMLREELLPELAQRRGPYQGPRVWSAGCSSGEEPYTLAILLAEAGLEGSQILATDLSRAALARARAAYYRRWSLRELSDGVLPLYFQRTDDGFTLREQYRNEVGFARANLIGDGPPAPVGAQGTFDLVVCRNVLIYFERDAVERVAHRLYQALTPGGWLLTGSSDPPLQALAPFEVVMHPAGVFYRRATRAASYVPSSWPATQPTAEPTLAAAMEGPVSPPYTPTHPPAVEPLGDLERPQEWVDRVRATANQYGSAQAAVTCRAGLKRHPLTLELHYLLALLLLDQGQPDEALEQTGRLLYLDRTLVVGHLLAATLARRLGDVPGAIRAYNTARTLAESFPDQQLAPLSEGQTFGSLRATAIQQLHDLSGPREGSA